MKKSIALMATVALYAQIAVAEISMQQVENAVERGTKKIGYATGINIINEAKSYTLQVSGLANASTNVGKAGTKNDIGYVPVNALTKKFTVTALKDGAIVAKQSFLREPNKDVYVINVSSAGGMKKPTITATSYSASEAAAMDEYKQYELN
jgi:hypothetical protein